jgi:hypothetical protein
MKYSFIITIDREENLSGHEKNLLSQHILDAIITASCNRIESKNIQVISNDDYSDKLPFKYSVRED